MEQPENLKKAAADPKEPERQQARADQMVGTAMARQKIADEIIEASSTGNMLLAARRVHGKQLALAERLLDKALRARGEPPRILVEVSRELRQTSERLEDLIKTQSAAAEAEQFFADLDAHLAAAAPGLADGARPYERSRPESAA